MSIVLMLLGGERYFLKRLVLQGDWIKKSISTLHWQLIFIAAKVVFHSKLFFIKVKHSCFFILDHFLSNLNYSLSPPS
jgi:hypothetical protein